MYEDLQSFEQEEELRSVMAVLKRLENPKMSRETVLALTEKISDSLPGPVRRKPIFPFLAQIKAGKIMFAASVASVCLLLVTAFFLSAIPDLAGPRSSDLAKLPKIRIADQTGGPGQEQEGLKLSAGMPQLPEQVMVYQKNTREFSEDEVSALVKKFGITVRNSDKLDDGSKIIIGKNKDTLTVDNYGFYFSANGAYDNEGIGLPSAEDAKELALKFLSQNDLLPKDQFDTEVWDASSVGRFDPASGKDVNIVTSRGVALRRSLGTYRDLNSIITVEVGDRGKIVGVRVMWAQISPLAEYPIISPEDAWEKVKTGNTIFDRRLTGTVDRISLAYISHPDRSSPASTYLQPVYVFKTRDGSTMVQAVREDYVTGTASWEKEEENPEDRTGIKKEFSMPTPVKIEVMEKGIVTKVVTPDDKSFSEMTVKIEKMLVRTRPSPGGGSMVNLEETTEDQAWFKPRELMRNRYTLHVIFGGNIRISTSLEPDRYAETDRYGNHVIKADDLYLVLIDNQRAELLYDDGKILFFKTLAGI